MKTKIFLLSLLSIFLVSCGGNDDSDNLPEPPPEEPGATIAYSVVLVDSKLTFPLADASFQICSRDAQSCRKVSSFFDKDYYKVVIPYPHDEELLAVRVPGWNSGAVEITNLKVGELNVIALETDYSGEWTITLSWTTPGKDFDLHLVAPNDNHSYFDNPDIRLAGSRIWLAKDDPGPGGSEIIKIKGMDSLLGKYKIVVHDYSNRPLYGVNDIASSNTSILIEFMGQKIISISPPQAEGTLWTPCIIDISQPEWLTLLQSMSHRTDPEGIN